MFKYIIILLLIIITSDSDAVLNSFRHNSFLFSTGISIDDNFSQHGDSHLLNHVCYDINVCIEYPSALDPNLQLAPQTYFNYVQSFDPVLFGTMNITLDASSTSDTLRLLMKYYDLEDDPLFTVEKGGVDGFQKSKLGGTVNVSDDANETNGANLQNIYTFLQVGTSLFGPSIWVRADLDTNRMSINAYKNVNLSLEPMNPRPLALQGVKGKGHSVQIGYESSTPKFLVTRNATTGKGVLCTGYTVAECEAKQSGLAIEGSLLVQRLFGKVGIIGAGFDGKNATFLGGSHADFVINDVDFIVSDSETNIANWKVVYIGFVSITNFKYDGGIRAWMQKDLNTQNELDACQEPNSTNGENKSNHGKFDFQRNWNEETSFTFFMLETLDGLKERFSRSFRFCFTYIDGANHSWLKDWDPPYYGEVKNENVRADVSYGVIGYGLPVLRN